MATRKAPDLNRENLIAAIEQHYGNVLSIAKHFGVARNTIYSHLERENLKAELEEARETFIDFAEGALVERIMAKDTTAIIFALKTRGKTRGYIEKVETLQSGQLEIVIRNADR